MTLPQSTVLTSAVPSLASAAAEQPVVSDSTNPMELHRRVTGSGQEDVSFNRNLDITECIKVAMSKCQRDIEQARVSDEPVVIQKGLAAEEIIKLLGGLVDLRWSCVLKGEIDAVLSGKTLDLRQRMDMSWKNNLIAVLSKAEVHIKNFIDTLVVEEPPNISKECQSGTPVAVSATLPIRSVPSIDDEKKVVNDFAVKPSRTPAKTEMLIGMIEPQVVKVGAPSEVINAKPHADVAVDVRRSPHDSTKDHPDQVFRAVHRKLKPPKNGRVVPTTLTNLDVPRGRGGVINRHPGHQFLLARVCLYREQYKVAKRGEKELLAKKLVQEIQERNGRFLDYLTNKQGDKTWYEIDDEASIKVVQQKLRELPVRLKDKWRTPASDTDEASGGHDEVDHYGQDLPPLTVSPFTVPKGSKKGKAKGEHEAAMTLLSL